MPAPVIYQPPPFQRSFALAPDPNSAAGGTNLETMLADPTDFPGGDIPDLTSPRPVTTATHEWTPSRITRANEVTSQRAARPDIPFKVSPMLNWTVNAYRRDLEIALKYAMGAEGAVTGSGPYTHPLSPIGFGSSLPPTMLVQLIRDAINIKCSGVAVESAVVTFPFDGPGTITVEGHPLYSRLESTPQPTGVAVEPQALPMVLRDAFIVFDGGASIPSPGAPTLTPSATGGTLPAAANYNYRIAALNAVGGTIPGPEAAANATTTGATSSIVVTWAAVPGATGYQVYGRTQGGEMLLATVGNVLTYTDTGAQAPANAIPTINSTAGGILPISISQLMFEFKNNSNYERQVAGHCVDTKTVGAINPVMQRLWFPHYHKLSARQTVTFGVNFLDTQLAQEIASEWGQIQKIVATVAEPNTAGNQAQFSMFATELTGGGVDALTATGDQVSAFTGNSYYSSGDGSDVQVAITNTSATPIA